MFDTVTVVAHSCDGCSPAAGNTRNGADCHQRE